MNKDVLNEGVFFALQEPKYVSNPYALYRQLRSEAPLHWDFLLCGWFLTRYADVRSALADQRLTTRNFSFDVTQLPPDLQNSLSSFGRVKACEVLYNDSPEHDRLRRPLHRAFNPTAFERMLPKMERQADELLGKAARGQLIDIVTDYSEPLANYMVTELLGIPDAERHLFIEWCNQVKQLATAPRFGNKTVVTARKAVQSLETIRAYIARMVSARCKIFSDDVIGRSLAVEQNETPLSEDEILANCVFFLHAGARNMSAAITNAVLVLLQHPEQFAHLSKHPDSISTSIEELLRYETPVHVAIRGTTQEIELGGHRIGPGQLLVLLLGAANRDPEQFADPDRLDLLRRPNHHVSFGVGAHGCVGAAMARYGLTTAIGAILRRKIVFRLARRRLQWIPASLRRTVRTLPVFVDGRCKIRRSTSRVVHARFPNPIASRSILVS